MLGDEWHEALLQNKGRSGSSGINAPQAELRSEVIADCALIAFPENLSYTFNLIIPCGLPQGHSLENN
jgi:hypothetical protein